MAVFAEFPGMNDVSERAAKAWQAPLGAVSPLWMAFGAAAGAGVAYWWLTQWARAVNVEALAGGITAFAAPRAALLEVPAEPAPAQVAELAPEPAPAVAEAAPQVEPIAAAPEPELELEPVVVEAPVTADDLTRMSGIGPKLSQALADRGVTRFAQIAAWTAEEVVEFDKALSLKGRAMREAWVAQAKRLAAAGG